MAFAFVPPDGYRNTTSFPTKPANEAQFRDEMQSLLDQTRDYMNTSLANKTQSGWNSPTLLNSWVNYGSLGFAAAGYMKDTVGFVHIKGIIRSGTTANGTTLFILPVGFRPFETHSFIVNTSNGTNDTFARIDVNSNGSVVAQTNFQSAFLSLGIFSFLAEQ